MAGDYKPQERAWLLALARRSVDAAARGEPSPEVPDVPPRLQESRACFVTLTLAGELRGCIGNIFSDQPLYENVIANARGAALRDTRFSPVAPTEVPSLRIEISVLTVPRPLEFSSPEDLLTQLRPGIDGVVLRIGSQYATFLPQVWEHLPDKEDFMDRLAQKAGWEAEAWRYAFPVVSVYQAESFEEDER